MYMNVHKLFQFQTCNYKQIVNNNNNIDNIELVFCEYYAGNIIFFSRSP